jgi:hypothetical protein
MAQSPDAAELTVGVDAVPTVLAGAALHNLRFRIFEPQGQPPTTQDNRAWRSLLSTSAVRGGPVVYRLQTKHTVRSHLEDCPGSLRLAMGVVDGEAGL